MHLKVKYEFRNSSSYDLYSTETEELNAALPISRSTLQITPTLYVSLLQPSST